MAVKLGDYFNILKRILNVGKINISECHKISQLFQTVGSWYKIIGVNHLNWNFF